MKNNNTYKAKFSRRTFLKSSIATGLLYSSSGICRSEASAPSSNEEKQIAVLVDLTRCIGCRACERACNSKNQLERTVSLESAWKGAPGILAHNRWTVVNLEDEANPEGSLPVKRQCMHCLDPACVSVCPVGALHKLPSGAVVYRKERCIGCRYCMFACPFKIPKFEWESSLTPVIGKCQFCAQHSLFTGPACAASCPTGALKFESREQLLFEAHARIHARPDRYIDHIYGEHEAGGTSWLYLSHRPFEKLNFENNLPSKSLPSLTRIALDVIPFLATLLAALFSFLAFAIKGEKKEQGYA